MNAEEKRESITYNIDQIENHILLVGEFLDGLSFSKTDLKTQYAVLKAFENIGESSKRLPTFLKERVTVVAWPEIYGFRNWITHQYDEINDEIVELAITGELPKLVIAVTQLRQILATFTPSDPLP
jgi:uncharacterized protein with HEPN domain